MKQLGYAKPNVDVIKRILGENYLCNIKVVKLSEDGHFKCLQYRYISNRDIKKHKLSLEDFQPIMEALDKLHHQGYVHSDVRLVNMIFPESGKGKLIDFDLTDKIGTRYPGGYRYFSERHETAMPFQPRCIIHDRHSLIYIILHNAKLAEDESQD